MEKVRVIAENRAEKKANKGEGWELRGKEYERKNKSLHYLNENVFLAMEELMTKALQTKDNFVFSPVALYLALISLAKITDGNTQKQLLELLRLEKPALVKIYNALESVASATIPEATSTISSSLWVNDCMEFNEELLLQLNEKLHLESYTGEMGTVDMNSAIAEWVKKTTGNLLDDSVDIKTERNTFLELLTTIYFASMWYLDFDEGNTAQGSFYLADGSEVQCEFMKQWIRTLYHSGHNFTAITKALKGGYNALFILPDKGVGINDVLRSKDWYSLVTKGYIRSQEMLVDLSMPKYDISTKLDLKELRRTLGVKDAFDSARADFTPISKIPEIYLAKAEQTTRFKVNEQGIEAASYVEFGCVVAGIPPKVDEVKFVLDRPFLFLVTAENCVPVFAGKVENPCEK